MTNAGRVQNRVALIELMRELTLTRSTREWVTLLESAGVPCGPINTIADVFEDPQVKARGMQIHMDHAARDDVALARIVADYVAGMTDRFALSEAQRLL